MYKKTKTTRALICSRLDVFGKFHSPFQDSTVICICNDSHESSNGKIQGTRMNGPGLGPFYYFEWSCLTCIRYSSPLRRYVPQIFTSMMLFRYPCFSHVVFTSYFSQKSITASVRLNREFLWCSILLRESYEVVNFQCSTTATLVKNWLQSVANLISPNLFVLSVPTFISRNYYQNEATLILHSYICPGVKAADHAGLLSSESAEQAFLLPLFIKSGTALHSRLQVTPCYWRCISWAEYCSGIMACSTFLCSCLTVNEYQSWGQQAAHLLMEIFVFPDQHRYVP